MLEGGADVQGCSGKVGERKCRLWKRRTSADALFIGFCIFSRQVGHEFVKSIVQSAMYFGN